MAKPVQRAALAGAGIIGSGWAARFLGAGLDVAAWDPAPDSEGKARAAIRRATRTAVRDQYAGLGRRIALLLVRALGKSTLLIGYATTL